MAEIPKSERIFRIIRILRERKKTVKQLSEILSVSERNIYRDLEDIRILGYTVPSDLEARYSLGEESTGKSTHFTLEETRLIREYLSVLPGTHPLKKSIETKLYLSSELIPLADELTDKHRGTMVSRINEAISNGNQIKLIKYQSNNSATQEDRLVEPISLSEDFTILNAFEVKSQKQKTFKIARMEAVLVLNSNNKTKVTANELDIFGFTGPQPITVTVQLSFTAHRLLFEEFPASRAYLSQNSIRQEFPFEFKYEVRDFRGIGRFLLGLPGQISVIAPPALKEYLVERAGKGYG